MDTRTTWIPLEMSVDEALDMLSAITARANEVQARLLRCGTDQQDLVGRLLMARALEQALRAMADVESQLSAAGVARWLIDDALATNDEFSL